MKARIVVLVCTVAVLGLCLSAEASVPGQIAVQGKLTDNNGDPLSPGVKTLTFSIYPDSAGGIKLWPLAVGGGEVQTVTTGQDGLWTAFVGAIYPLTSGVFTDPTRWLEITVQDGASPAVTMPRVRLATGPYAFRVATVDEATGGDIYGSLRIGSGNTSSGNDVLVTGKDNTATGEQSSITGGHDNTASGEGAHIGGGINNDATGEAAAVGGGKDNTAGSFDATVAGGRSNQAGDAAFVGGGLSNRALGVQSTVGGGHGNYASHIGAAVTGGFWNRARGDYSVVCGGGGFDEADSNLALGMQSFVGGGRNNIAMGVSSSIPGGSGNAARGDYSSAAGFNARANHLGSFVWGNYNAKLDTVGSDTLYQFKIRAENGVRISHPAGESKPIRTGDRYRDNAICAWASVAANGDVGNNEFGIESVVHNGTGNYVVTMDAGAENLLTLVPVACVAVETTPTSAAAARLIYVNQTNQHAFSVYITNGAYSAVDNDFVLIVTAR